MDLPHWRVQQSINRLAEVRRISAWMGSGVQLKRVWAQRTGSGIGGGGLATDGRPDKLSRNTLLSSCTFNDLETQLFSLFFQRTDPLFFQLFLIVSSTLVHVFVPVA